MLITQGGTQHAFALTAGETDIPYLIVESKLGRRSTNEKTRSTMETKTLHTTMTTIGAYDQIMFLKRMIAQTIKSDTISKMPTKTMTMGVVNGTIVIRATV